MRARITALTVLTSWHINRCQSRAPKYLINKGCRYFFGVQAFDVFINVHSLI